MNFDNKMPTWGNKGTEPSTDLKTNGFQPLMQPPAGVFNWFWAKASAAVTELQNKLSTADEKIKPIAEGGTGKTTRKEAFLGLAYMGYDPIKTVEQDTVTNWVALGVGFAYYNTKDCINGQPAQYGTLFNLTNSEGDLTQVWQNRPSGVTYIRGGNVGGWYNGGKWEKVALSSEVTKTAIGLGNVDNTADADKTVKNSMLFKSHDMKAEDCFLYVNTNTVTIQTTEMWYLKIVLQRGYSNHSASIRLEADYDNCKNVMYLNLEGIGNKWSAKVTDYNSMNILGVRVETGATTTLHLKMRAPTASGKCQIHTDYNITEMVTYDGSGESFTEIPIGFSTNMPIVVTDSTAKQKTRASLCVSEAIESTEYPGCYYRTVDGETEWINPPMLKNVEYRTTERYNGLPVYTKRYDFGPVDTTGGELTIIASRKITNIVDAPPPTVVVHRSNTVLTLPCDTDSTLTTPSYTLTVTDGTAVCAIKNLNFDSFLTFRHVIKYTLD